jgi:hypothetical protein
MARRSKARANGGMIWMTRVQMWSSMILKLTAFSSSGTNRKSLSETGLAMLAGLAGNTA